MVTLGMKSFFLEIKSTRISKDRQTPGSTDGGREREPDKKKTDESYENKAEVIK